MAKKITLSAEVETTPLSVTVTAAPGSAGSAVAYSSASSSVTLTNISGACDMQYKVDNGAWVEMERYQGVVLPINLAASTLYLRRVTLDGGLCNADLVIDGAPVLAAGAMKLAQLAQDASGNTLGIVGGDSSISQFSYLPEVASVALDMPGTIAGLKLWLDASSPLYSAAYAAQAKNLGDTVAIIPDKSGNNVGLTVPASTPTFDPIGMNGRPTINFNGNSYFNAAAFFTSAFDSSITVFVVSKRTDGGALQVAMGTTGAKNFWLQRDSSAKQTVFSSNSISPAIAVFPYTDEIGVDAFVFDGAKAKSMYNGFFSAQGNSSTTSASVPVYSYGKTGTLGVAGQDLGIGALQGGTFKWSGSISEVLIYSAALSDADQNRVLAYLSAKWGFNKKTIVCCGDSLTAGSGSVGGVLQTLSPSGDNYPGRLWGILGAAGYDVRIDGFAGNTLSAMLSVDSVSDAVSKLNSTKPTNIVWAGTNTLTVYKSAGLAIQQLQRFCLARRLAKSRVFVMTTLPRGDVIYAGFENDRQIYNKFIRENYLKFSDGLIDVAADSRLQNVLDTTYFNADKIHLTNAGYSIVASLVAPFVV